jgi:serine phosphatase RsbU (regulator of sigma subunit)/pSer/pThr/pTyr-binding forkhead associated (FHA) protein
VTHTAILRYFDADGRHEIALDRASITIGRSPDQDVVLGDPQVSRQHAAIAREGETLTVTDRNSTRGTYLNGVRLEAPAMLRHGDVLQFGSAAAMKMKVHLRAGEEDEETTSALMGLLTARGSAQLPLGAERSSAREMEQLNWLLKAARQLNERGAVDEILRVLLQLTVQLTGVERGFVFLNQGGAMHFAQGLDLNGEPLDEDPTISHRAMQQAVENESKFSVSDTYSDKRASEWSSVLANKIRSIYCIPLRKRAAAQQAELLGLLYLDSQTRPGSLTKVDHELLDAIATEAAALVHNALLAESEHKARQAREELAIAARIHSGLMSTALPKLSYAEVNAKTVPCLAIGGDFYDVVVLEDCVCATIVDVSGKGVSAAIVAATLEGIIHAQLLARQSLVEIAAMVNHFLCTRDVGKYATMVIARLFADGRLEYLNCGHIQPVAVLGSEVRMLEKSNLIVGLIPEAKYVCGEDRLRPNERLLLTTDGVTEAENSLGEAFGEARFCELARELRLEAILHSVAEFHAPHPAQDDCTLLELRFTGGAPPADFLQNLDSIGVNGGPQS